MEVAYSATKGGVNGFTKALAKELAPSNISVNAIACGFVDTDMNRNLNPEELEEVKEEIPANRFYVLYFCPLYHLRSVEQVAFQVRECLTDYRNRSPIASADVHYRVIPGEIHSFSRPKKGIC